MGLFVQIGSTSWVGTAARLFDQSMRWLSVVVGAFAKVNPDKFHTTLTPYIKALQAGWLVPAVLITTPMAVWLRHRTDKSRLVAAHGLLDQICDHSFKNESFDHEQHRRVTLFKYRWATWRRWPFFGGWLIPIERSGTLTRNTNAIFRAPDDGEKCEGVAGRAWSKQAKVYVPNLPDLRRSPSEVQFIDYAAKSFVDAARLKSKPPQARSLLGIPVEVGQKRWGVIVIDSVRETIPHKGVNNCFKLIAPTLSGYLKGI